MTGSQYAAWSLHGIAVEMACSDADTAAAAARLMGAWPQADARRADIRFDIERADATRLARPHLPRGRGDHWPGLEIGADGHILWFRREACGSVVVADLPAGRAQAYVADRHKGARAVEHALNGMLLVALVQMLAHRRVFSIHACAAARDGRAIIAAAKRGAGKSTLAASLARAGLSVLSDDRLLVRRGPTGIECLAWRGPVNLSEESIALFPELAGLALSRGTFEGKRGVAPEEVYHMPRVDSAAPGVLLFPRVSDRPGSAIEDLSPGAALALLVPCSLFYAHQQVLPEHLALLRDLVGASRCCRVSVGRDVAEIGQRLAGLLSSS
jgi:hypothetical protein